MRKEKKIVVRKPHLNASDSSAIAYCLEAGLKPKELAEKFGVSLPTIYNHRKRLGLVHA